MSSREKGKVKEYQRWAKHNYVCKLVLHSKLDSTSCREVIFLQNISHNRWTLTEKNISTQEREREGERERSVICQSKRPNKTKQQIHKLVIQPYQIHVCCQTAVKT